MFTERSAEVFAANGIETVMYKEPIPIPCISFAVREIGCSAGIVFTDLHNTAKYNGYKVYGADGAQMTVKVADEIQSQINKVDIFKDVKRISFNEGINSSLIAYMPDLVLDNYIEAVKNLSVESDKSGKGAVIVYSPLNGTGLNPVMRTLKESGFTNIMVVNEQEMADGRFPTCPYQILNSRKL